MLTPYKALGIIVPMKKGEWFLLRSHKTLTVKENTMKSLPKTKPFGQPYKEEKRMPYERPAIIYEGQITTRAGSPTVPDGARSDGVDPSDLFGEP